MMYALQRIVGGAIEGVFVLAFFLAVMIAIAGLFYGAALSTAYLFNIHSQGGLVISGGVWFIVGLGALMGAVKEMLG